MIDLQDFWNKNSARIPDDKGHSLYAAEKEKEFPKNATVCDLGGGTGADSIYFAEKGHNVILVDIVYSRLALHYFESEVLSRLFAEIYRILRRSGKAYLTLKSPDDAAEMKFLSTTATEQEEGVFNEDGRIKTRYKIMRLEEMLAGSGIPNDSFRVVAYTEKLGNDNDIVKSGSDEFIVNQVMITK